MMIEKGFKIIRSCESDKHIVSAITYVGLLAREMRKMGINTEEDIEVALNALYTFMEAHTLIMKKNVAVIQNHNMYQIKNYDVLKLSIL